MDTSDIEMMFRDKVEQMKQFNQNCKKSLQNYEQPSTTIRAALRSLLSEETLDELRSIGNHTAAKSVSVVEEERACQKNMRKLEKEIAQLKTECNRLRSSLELEDNQIKEELVALKMADCKYSTVLGMKVETSDLDDQHYVASVNFAGGRTEKSINLTVNRITRRVTAFDANQLRSLEQAAELRKAITDQEGQIDMPKLIGKVRPIFMGKTT